MSSGLNEHVFKEDIEMANKQMRRCSASLFTREMQIETIMSYYLTVKKQEIDGHYKKITKCCLGYRNFMLWVLLVGM